MHTASTPNAGQAAFTKPVLALYDQLVLGITCHWIWRCPTVRILDWYQQHLTDNHLDVGVGTGYFLNAVRFPTQAPRLALLDLNTHCLQHTRARLARYRPESYQANVLEPIELDIPKFDSIGLNYVLHCLPGSLPDKGIVFAHLAKHLTPRGRLFGATLLQGGVQRSLLAKGFMRLYNSRHIFSNRHDAVGNLIHALELHFDNVRIDIVGSVALFSGRRST